MLEFHSKIALPSIGVLIDAPKPLQRAHLLGNWCPRRSADFDRNWRVSTIDGPNLAISADLVGMRRNLDSRRLQGATFE